MERRKRLKASLRQKGSGYKYTADFKRKAALQYLNSDMTLMQVGRMFNVSHQHVSEWAHEFYAELSVQSIIPAMTEQEQKEVAALQKQIELLKEKLEYEQMRNFAWETMADLAKTELGIDIRKNSGAKQPKE